MDDLQRALAALDDLQPSHLRHAYLAAGSEAPPPPPSATMTAPLLPAQQSLLPRSRAMEAARRSSAATMSAAVVASAGRVLPFMAPQPPSPPPLVEPPVAQTAAARAPPPPPPPPLPPPTSRPSMPSTLLPSAPLSTAAAASDKLRVELAAASAALASERSRHVAERARLSQALSERDDAVARAAELAAETSTLRNELASARVQHAAEIASLTAAHEAFAAEHFEAVARAADEDRIAAERAFGEERAASAAQLAAALAERASLLSRLERLAHIEQERDAALEDKATARRELLESRAEVAANVTKLRELMAVRESPRCHEGAPVSPRVSFDATIATAHETSTSAELLSSPVTAGSKSLTRPSSASSSADLPNRSFSGVDLELRQRAAQFEDELATLRGEHDARIGVLEAELDKARKAASAAADRAAADSAIAETAMVALRAELDDTQRTAAAQNAAHAATSAKHRALLSEVQAQAATLSEALAAVQAARARDAEASASAIARMRADVDAATWRASHAMDDVEVATRTATAARKEAADAREEAARANGLVSLWRESVVRAALLMRSLLYLVELLEASRTEGRDPPPEMPADASSAADSDALVDQLTRMDTDALRTRVLPLGEALRMLLQTREALRTALAAARSREERAVAEADAAEALLRQLRVQLDEKDADVSSLATMVDELTVQLEARAATVPQLHSRVVDMVAGSDSTTPDGASKPASNDTRAPRDLHHARGLTVLPKSPSGPTTTVTDAVTAAGELSATNSPEVFTVGASPIAESAEFAAAGPMPAVDSAEVVVEIPPPPPPRRRRAVEASVATRSHRRRVVAPTPNLHSHTKTGGGIDRARATSARRMGESLPVGVAVNEVLTSPTTHDDAIDFVSNALLKNGVRDEAPVGSIEIHAGATQSAVASPPPHPLLYTQHSTYYTPPATAPSLPGTEVGLTDASFNMDGVSPLTTTGGGALSSLLLSPPFTAKDRSSRGLMTATSDTLSPAGIAFKGGVHSRTDAEEMLQSSQRTHLQGLRVLSEDRAFVESPASLAFVSPTSTLGDPDVTTLERRSGDASTRDRRDFNRNTPENAAESGAPLGGSHDIEDKKYSQSTPILQYVARDVVAQRAAPLPDLDSVLASLPLGGNHGIGERCEPHVTGAARHATTKRGLRALRHNPPEVPPPPPPQSAALVDRYDSVFMRGGQAANPWDPEESIVHELAPAQAAAVARIVSDVSPPSHTNSIPVLSPEFRRRRNVPGSATSSATSTADESPAHDGDDFAPSSIKQRPGAPGATSPALIVAPHLRSALARATAATGAFANRLAASARPRGATDDSL